MAEPRRGEVWEDQDGRKLLILSADFWNTLDVDEVAVVRIAELEGEPSDETYVPVVEALDHQWEVFADVLFGVDKANLQDWVLTLDEAAMRHVSYVVRAELLPNPGEPDPRRPRRLPRQGQIRFADLRIGNGVESKPVLVVSSEEYAQQEQYEFVIVCRVSSNQANLYNLDVKIGDGKVVCSDVRTVSSELISERTTRQPAVSRAEQAEVRNKLFRFLGLD